MGMCVTEHLFRMDCKQKKAQVQAKTLELHKKKASPRSLGNSVRKSGVRNRCLYRRCGVDTGFPYRLLSSLIVCAGWSGEAEFAQWFWRHRGSILNFRIGFLSSIGGRLSRRCLSPPFRLLDRPHPQYSWDFPEELPEKFRKDPENAFRDFPLEGTAGIPQAL